MTRKSSLRVGQVFVVYMNKKGFTILELSIVIVILTIISSLMFVSFNTARQVNRDTKRVADVNEMQTALALYYRDWGRYPSTSAVTGGMAFASGTITYLSPWPQDPPPLDDGDCLGLGYVYNAVDSGANPGVSYSIQFCLGAVNSDIGPGVSYAIPDDIITCVPNCVLSCGAGNDGCGGTCANIASCATGYTCVSYHCQKN
jgi:prepilin-type N-terminal cleavage/methylation domain-containing protein